MGAHRETTTVPVPRDTPRRGPRLGAMLAWLVTLTLLAGGLAWGVPRVLQRAGLDETAVPWGPECAVDIGDEHVALSVEQARAATTAVALEARGATPEDTPDVDRKVMERLRTGPPDDAGPSLTCRAAATDGLEAEEMTASGLTPRAERPLAAIREVFGDVSVGGFEPGGIDSGHGENSTHYEGRAIDVFFRPVTEENRRAGWLLAHWLVAHAEVYDISVVIFDDRIWSVRFAAAGWRDYQVSDPDNEILRHLDHVHVDVQRGG